MTVYISALSFVCDSEKDKHYECDLNKDKVSKHNESPN